MVLITPAATATVNCLALVIVFFELGIGPHVLWVKMTAADRKNGPGLLSPTRRMRDVGAAATSGDRM